jgi:hypothetical protein
MREPTVETKDPSDLLQRLKTHRTLAIDSNSSVIKKLFKDIVQFEQDTFPASTITMVFLWEAGVRLESYESTNSHKASIHYSFARLAFLRRLQMSNHSLLSSTIHSSLALHGNDVVLSHVIVTKDARTTEPC